MRNRPSEPAYRCARVSAGPSSPGSPSSKTASDGVISLRTAISLENQPRRNEEHEDFFSSFFVLFVSSRLIFIRRAKIISAPETEYAR
jgi:hypothetical protein